MSSTEQQLQDRVQELEALLGVGNDDVSRLLTVLDATPQQCEMVGFMLKRAVAGREAMFTVLFGARPECDKPEMKLIDVQMVKVRAALEKVGIVVHTEWGAGGWSLARADKARLRAMMEGREPPPAAAPIAAPSPSPMPTPGAREEIRERRVAFLEGA
ncbi:hypothetical protein HU230_0011665 [Bradyrhizobium quebecense]|uniref:Uncharacterized protein n=1 Tax=Bradyrhizobium quebecense TaxID=2748629 RepID=A0A974ADR8_9BRAD|nr:hypothetical protein [Bradyrhizobium quebecense]UGA46651.1 hypothetical protein HU230_0011665 [Bradyrhizobium quebecense]